VADLVTEEVEAIAAIGEAAAVEIEEAEEEEGKKGLPLTDD
jgi:hypothetical protein